MNQEQIPYSFEKNSTAAEIKEQHSGIPDGSEAGTKASVAGRVLLRRVQGKIAFVSLADSSGRIQLFAPADTTPDYEAFIGLSLGDWVGVSGEILKTKKGELSVRVDNWTVLARTLKPFPEKWHGLADQDLRYRQRWLDLWVNPEVREAFKLRSRIISLTRNWLETSGFMEVETPVLQTIPGGADARPFITHHNSLDMEMFLRVAPELYLKRLVIGGFEKVFEIGRVFRNEGLSTRHNPEFTMLEAYQAYADYKDMMELTENLVSHLAKEIHGTEKIPHGGQEGEEKKSEIDLSPGWRRATMYELIAEHTGKEVSLQMSAADLRKAAAELDVEADKSWGAGKLILEIYEKRVESNLTGPVFVCDYPKEVSPLARTHREDPDLVERFEAIIGGHEIANAFSELNDPKDQAERFSSKTHQDEDDIRYDADYISALEYGLPPTGGLGIGIDRLTMLLTGSSTIRDVLLFPTLKPPQE